MPSHGKDKRKDMYFERRRGDPRSHVVYEPRRHRSRSVAGSSRNPVDTSSAHRGGPSQGTSRHDGLRQAEQTPASPTPMPSGYYSWNERSAARQAGHRRASQADVPAAQYVSMQGNNAVPLGPGRNPPDETSRGPAAQYVTMHGSHAVPLGPGRNHPDETTHAPSMRSYAPPASAYSHRSPPPPTRSEYSHNSPPPSIHSEYSHGGPMSSAHSRYTDSNPMSPSRSGYTDSNPMSSNRSGYTDSNPMSSNRSGYTDSNPMSSTRSGYTDSNPMSSNRSGYTDSNPISSTRSGYTGSGSYGTRGSSGSSRSGSSGLWWESNSESSRRYLHMRPQPRWPRRSG